MTDRRFTRVSGLSLSALLEISERLRVRLPVMHAVLSDPAGSDEELYQGMTGGLIRYLKNDDPVTLGLTLSQTIKIQQDVVFYLAGRFS